MPYYSTGVGKSLSHRSNLPWLVVTLLAQTAWGAYPVTARYLQTVSNLPSMSLIGTGALIALVVVSIWFLPRVQLRDLKSGRLMIFAVIVVGRGLTNFLAARFTLAIYVQLITLMTPFVVAFLSTVVWHENLPRYTARTLMAGSFGVLLILGSDFFGVSSMPAANRTDWLGISLAVASSLLLAIYMIAVRRSTLHNISGEALLLVQLFSLAAAGLLLSYLLDEPWQQWRAMTSFDWFVFGMVVFGVLIGANLGQIGAIRHLGAAMVSSTMPWRLISVVGVSTLLLGERLTSIWQLIGLILVMFSVTWYLWQQR